jgi:alpha-glucosidase
VKLQATKLILAVVLAASAVASGQTLAHRGWEGSGLSADPWWRTAVFYQLDPMTFQAGAGGVSPLGGVAGHLDYLQSLSVDAMILSPLQLGPPVAGAAPALEPDCGSLDDFDNLIQQASGRKIRVLVDLPLSTAKSTDDLTSVARFWLSRGVAGLRVVRDPAEKTAPTADQVNAALQGLRQVAAGFVGQRVLIVDGDLGAAATPTSTTDAAAAPASPKAVSRPATASQSVSRSHRTASAASSAAGPAASPARAQLTLDAHAGFLTHLDGNELRTALAAAEPPGRLATVAPAFATDRTGLTRSFTRYGDGKNDMAIARLLATILLTNRSAAVVYAGQELGLSDAATAIPWGSPQKDRRGKPLPPTGLNVLAEDADGASLLNWYRALAALHHGNPALASGTSTLLDTGDPDVVAWLRKPASGAVAVILCNLSGKPAHVSILAGIRAATGQRKGFLHTLLPSVDPSMYMPPASIENVPLPAYGVYLGELKR